MQAADGKGYATLLSKNISPSELVLLPVERCVWLLFSLCYTGFKSSRLKCCWYQWVLLKGKSTFLLYWKEMSEHTWNDDVAVLKWAVKFDVLTIINAPAEMMMILGWSSSDSLLSASQLDVLDRCRPREPSDDREVVDGRFRKKFSDCAHCSGCTQPHRWRGRQEAVLDQRLQEGEFRKEKCAGELLNALWCFRYTGSWWIIIIPLT